MLIVAGLYFVLWGKHKENKEKETVTVSEAIKGSTENGRMQTIEEDDVEMQKCEARKEEQSSPAVAITVVTKA